MYISRTEKQGGSKLIFMPFEIVCICVLVRTLRDNNRPCANCVPMYGDLYQSLQWSLTFNLEVVTYLKSVSEASYDVINMATINRTCIDS